MGLAPRTSPSSHVCTGRESVGNLPMAPTTPNRCDGSASPSPRAGNGCWVSQRSPTGSSSRPSQVLTPIFDPGLSESSFGFRPGRSAHGALRQVQGHIKAGYLVAVDLDLAKFFDNVRHDVLMARVAGKVHDKGLLALMGRYLRAGVLVGESIQATELGTPQGGPLSPLLANILLDDLDHELERRGHRFARYADDLLVLLTSSPA